MFRLLARWIAAVKQQPPLAGPARDGDAATLFRFHPMQLHRYLEEAWAAGGFEPYVQPTPTSPEHVFLGSADIVAINQLPQTLRDTLLSGIGASPPATPGPFAVTGTPPPGLSGSSRQPWEHLIYAYLLENTGLMQIFRRVLELYSTGERLEVPSIETRMWLRSTEELFFRDPPPFHISSLTSVARPDLEASRRNAYWRMFGMDLNHGAPDGRPYPYAKPGDGNRDFVMHWEGLLQEIWQGYINRRNTSGENYSDPEAVANRAETLAQIMQVRRLRGNLAREEFFFTAMMSWFHLTLESDTAVVNDLKASAASPAERLRKIGERVGIASHPKSRSFFELAEPASSLLRFVELGRFNDTTTAEVLYNETNPNGIRDDALVVINHWSIATGRDLKLRRPSAATQPSQQRRVPVRPASANSLAPTRESELSLNGHHV